MNAKIYLLFALILLPALGIHRNWVWRNELSLWKDASEKSPLNSRTRQALANEYMIVGQMIDALSECECSLRIWPLNPLAHSLLAVILSDLSRDPSRGLNIILRAYELSQNIKIPIPGDEKSNQLLPRNFLTYLALGIYNKNLRKYNDAEASFKEAVKINPHFPSPFYFLGEIYWNLGEKEAARSQAVMAIRNNLKESEIYKYLGKLSDDLGLHETAMVMYKKALYEERNPLLNRSLQQIIDSGPNIGLDKLISP